MYLRKLFFNSHCLKTITIAFFLFCLIGITAKGVILHENEEPPVNWLPIEITQACGRWHSSGSCNAIGPNHIISAKHLVPTIDNNNPANNTPVTFNNIIYRIVETFSHTTADLRVSKIETLSGTPANLTYYVPFYDLESDSDFTSGNAEIAICSYGLYRGATLVFENDQNKPYGYVWFGDNSTIHMGANNLDLKGHIIPGELNWFNKYHGDVTTSSGTTDCLVFDFDDIGTGQHVQYEASVANKDSGGGWFYFKDNQWYIVGISLFVFPHSGETWFRDDSSGTPLAPELSFGAHLSQYITWVEGIVPTPTCKIFLEGDIDNDCTVDQVDLEMLIAQWLDDNCNVGNLYCLGGDIDYNGVVDLSDYNFLYNNWLETVPLY